MKVGKIWCFMGYSLKRTTFLIKSITTFVLFICLWLLLTFQYSNDFCKTIDLNLRNRINDPHSAALVAKSLISQKLFGASFPFLLVCNKAVRPEIQKCYAEKIPMFQLVDRLLKITENDVEKSNQYEPAYLSQLGVKFYFQGILFQLTTL